MSDIALYSYFKSSCAWRIRILLNLKRIDYEYRAVKLINAGAENPKGEQYSASFTALNPSAQVPVLVIDGISIAESVAIAEYVEETRPEPAVYPKDLKQRAQVRVIVETINAGIQGRHNLATIQTLVEQFTHDQASKPRWAALWITRGFTALEAMLAKCAGRCCVGDSVTFADCCLVPQVYAAFRFKVGVEQFPIIWRIFCYLDKLPAFAAAHADRQPDAVVA